MISATSVLARPGCQRTVWGEGSASPTMITRPLITSATRPARPRTSVVGHVGSRRVCAPRRPWVTWGVRTLLAVTSGPRSGVVRPEVVGAAPTPGDMGTGDPVINNHSWTQVHAQVCVTMIVSFSSFVDFSCALVWRWCNRNFPKVTLSVRRQIISPTRSPV